MVGHITIVGKKLSKKLELIYKAKSYLGKNAMVSLYYSLRHGAAPL